MYNTNIEKRYYMYSFLKNYALRFENFNELLDYVKLKNTISYNGKITNIYLDNISMNFNDVVSYWFFEKNEVSKRDYLFYDEEFRIIDLRLYSNEILLNNIKHKENKIKKGYVFRKTPISGIHKVKREGIYKQNRTKYLKEMKDNLNVEEKYIRKKRVNKLETFRNDDNLKSLSYSWKDQSKKERQWK